MTYWLPCVRFTLVTVLILGLSIGVLQFSTSAQDGDGWTLPELEAITLENAAELSQIATWGRGSLYGAEWINNGQTLAAHSSTGIWLYNIDDFSAEPGRIEVTGGLFSPVDNVLVSSGCDEPIKLWDLAESSVTATLGEASYRCPEILAIAPDGTMLASAARSKMINVWAIDGTDQPEPKFVLEATSAFVYVAFSPDASVLATGSGKSIQLWDTTTGQEITVLEGFDGSVYDVAFAPHSMILVAGTGYPDKSVRIWDVSELAAPRELAQLSFPAVDAVYNVAFNADGTFLAASGKTNFQIWEFFVEDNNVDYMPYLEVSGHKDDIQSLSFNPQQDLLLTSSLDQTIRVWNIHTGEQVAMIAGYMDTPILAYNHDGSLLAVAGEYEGANEAVVLLDGETGEVVRVLESDFNETDCLAFSPDGTLVAAGQGWLGRGAIKVWNVETGELHHHYEEVIRAGSLAFSPDNRWLATAPRHDDEQVYLIDLQSDEIAMTLGEDTYTDDVMGVAFNPDSTALAAGGLDEVLYLWDVQTGEMTAELTEIDSSIQAVQYSPDGSLLATGHGDGNVFVWNPTSGAVRTRLYAGVGRVSTLAFHPDQRSLLAVGGDNGATVWDLRANTELISLEGPQSSIRSLAFHPSGQILAGTGGDGVVRLWGVSVD